MAGCELLLLECAWLASKYWLHWLLVSISYVEPSRELEDIELTVLADTASSDISEVYKSSLTPVKNAWLVRFVSALERWPNDGFAPAPKEGWLPSQSAMASTDRPRRSWHKTSFHFLLCERVLMISSFEACWRCSCSMVLRRFVLDCRIGAL